MDKFCPSIRRRLLSLWQHRLVGSDIVSLLSQSSASASHLMDLAAIG